MSKRKRLKFSYALLSGLLPVFVFWGANFRVATASASEISAGNITIQATITTDDDFFTTDTDATDKQWYLPRISLPQAWTYGKGSDSVVVAIVDTGIRASHVDLNDGRVIGGYNVIKDTTISADANSDDNGHGTAIAGVIGAIANNQIGIAGINQQVSLMPIKALDALGNGTIPNVSKGIVWAADHGANIINLSLGASGFPESKTLSDAITYAFNKGVVIVAAAGNDIANEGANLDKNPAYPVCADNGQNMVIGVAASDNNDVKASFSDFGINCVDITAPGKRIITTGFNPSQPSDNILIYGSGTSLATPMVSGVAALLKANNPGYSNTQIRDIILGTADNIDAENTNNCLNTSCAGFLGHGRLNALKALSPAPLIENELVRKESNGDIYLIRNGEKHLVTPFVLQQKFARQTIVDEKFNALSNYHRGAPELPKQGTLIKSKNSDLVYYVDKEVIRPLTFLVFKSRNFGFADVQTISSSDLDTFEVGDWYWPPEGTLVLIEGNPTVYYMGEQVARPVTYFVFSQRRLSFAKVVTVTRDEFDHIPKAADNYWLSPMDGTLVKSTIDPTVFVIENGVKRSLSATAFKLRNYKFAKVKVLPKAEVDVIAPGNPIY